VLELQSGKLSAGMNNDAISQSNQYHELMERNQLLEVSSVHSKVNTVM